MAIREPLVMATNADWMRIVPGKGVDFEASHDQVFELLNAGLAAEYAPYALIAPYFDLALGRWRGENIPFSDFVGACRRGTWDFFIHSRRITGSFNLEEQAFPDSFCSVNGFLHLQHDHVIAPGVRSSLSIVWKVISRDQSVIVEHTEYLELFERLRRLLRPFAKRVSNKRC